MQWFLAIVVAGMLVVSYVVLIRRLAQAKPLSLAQGVPDSEPEQNVKPANKEAEHMLIIEHMPAEMSQADIGGFVASTAVQAELLEVGLLLVKKLPPHVRNFLSSPVFSSSVLANFSRLVSQSEGLEDVSPERVRATVAVAVVSLSLQDMMTWFGNKIGAPDQLVLERHVGVIHASIRLFHVEDIILQIILRTDLSHDTAEEMWFGIVEIMRDGDASIPGIKARPPLAGEIV